MSKTVLEVKNTKLHMIIFRNRVFYNLSLAITLLSLSYLFSQGERPSIKTKQIKVGSIKLDGVLNEDEWYVVEPATGFKQRDPIEGAPATEKTEVYIVYDDYNLYIGAKFYDSDPKGIKAYQKKRDAPLRGDDRFMFIIDTYRDYRTGYFFETNPAGLLGDGIIGVGGRFNLNKDWDGIWDVRTTKDEKGWNAEIVIPFQTLSFDPENDIWGINFQRTIRRKNEDVKWTGFKRGIWLTKPIYAGELRGLNGISSGRGLEVKPYYIFKDQYSSSESLGQKNNIGFDLSFNVAEGLKGSLTYNTDFAEAEVDDRIINLTRFPKALKEKRNFFLEGSGIYSFAPNNYVVPFFSRRIGISQGSMIPISYGGRLNGKLNGYEVGAMNLHTNSAENIPAENFKIARFKKSLFEASYLGFIYTGRTSKTDSIYQDQDLAGVDFDYSTANFMGDKDFQFQAFILAHDSKNKITTDFSDLSAAGVRLNYPNDLWEGHVSYRELGNNFIPSVGFNGRNGFKRLQPTIRYKPRPIKWKNIRQFEYGIEIEHMRNIEDQLIKREVKFHAFKIKFENGDEASIGSNILYEILDDDYEIRENNIISSGRYETNGFWIGTKTSNNRKIAAEIMAYKGGFWSGERQFIKAKIFFDFFPGINIFSEFEYNDVRLNTGDFKTALLKVILGIYPNPRLAFYNNIQFDDISNIIGLYSKIRYIVRPGSDLYLVFNNNWQDDNGGLGSPRFNTISRSSSIKINFTHRF